MNTLAQGILVDFSAVIPTPLSLSTHQSANTLTDIVGAHDIYLFLKFFFLPVIVLFTSTLITVIVYRRFSLDRIDRKKGELEDAIDTFLTTMVFSDFSEAEMRIEIDQFRQNVVKGNDSILQFVLKKLVHIKQNIQYLDTDKIIFMFKTFRFDVYTDQLINSSNPENKSEGFSFYQILEYKEKSYLIRPYLHSPNPKLRANALLAMISLSDENFDMLDEYCYSISRADELKILDIIYQKGYSLPTNIHRWLRSSNDSIVMIAIKMLVRYNTRPTYSEMEHLFTHRNPTVQKEIINAVRKLKIVEANDLLMECYKNETRIRIKIAIVKALQNTANTTNLNYALKILQLETDTDLKFEWVNCLCKMDRNFMNYIRVEDDQEKRLLQQMILHHTNPYINY
jgi:hypothetical protein